ENLDRQTHNYLPITNGNRGWKLFQYTAATQSTNAFEDLAVGITGSSPTMTCTTTCRHDQIVLDGLGRAVNTFLMSDPDGSTEKDTSYDSSGRMVTVSNPYRSTSDSTYGVETLAYDGLDRLST